MMLSPAIDIYWEAVPSISANLAASRHLFRLLQQGASRSPASVAKNQNPSNHWDVRHAKVLMNSDYLRIASAEGKTPGHQVKTQQQMAKHLSADKL